MRTNEGPIVVKNLRKAPVILDVVVGDEMLPVTVEGRGFYEVPEQAVVRNLSVLLAERSVVVLKLRSIRRQLR